MMTWKSAAALALMLFFVHVADAAGRPPPPKKVLRPPPPKNGCPFKYNSTDPKGYFVFSGKWFPTTKDPFFAGSIDTGNSTRTCGVLCSNSKYGFYIRKGYVENWVHCYCLTSEPILTEPWEITGPGTYSKICPIVEVSHPPPMKSAPPPLLKPPGCQASFNSSPPGYFFYETHTYWQYLANITKSVDVWPFNGAPLRCQKHCVSYKYGFALDYQKYAFTVFCYCITNDLTFQSPGIFGQFLIHMYTTTCPPNKGGRHPPGVGKHPPGVGKHPPEVGKHPPGVGKHPPGVGKHPPGVGKHPPRVGKHPPRVGKHPPGVGEHPPGVGKHPPRVGKHSHDQ